MEPKPEKRKSRVSIFFAPRRTTADGDGISKRQPDGSSLKQRASRLSSIKFPQFRRKRAPSIQFIRQDSDPLENRIYEPSCCRKCWRSMTTGIIEPREVTVEESFAYLVRSFLVYISHFILVLWVIYGSLHLERNYDSVILTDLITKSYFESKLLSARVTFSDIKSPIHIWEFVRGVILKIMFPVETTNSTLNSIWESNVMVGVPQIRQVRVKRDSCETAPFFTWLYKHCYDYYSEESEDKEAFGPNTSQPWRYSYNTDELDRGHFHYYSGNGFLMNFAQDYESTVFQLNELETNQWIRQGTRAVFLDFSIYCPNTAAYHVIDIVFELMPWGGVLPTLNIYPVEQVTSLNDPKEFVLLGLNVVLFCYTLGLNYAVYLRLRYSGMKALPTFKTINDIVIILSTYAVVGVHIATAVISHLKLQDLAETVHTPAHADFGIFILLNEAYFGAAAVLLLCIALKFIVFSYQFNQLAAFFVSVLDEIKGELACLTIMNAAFLTGMSMFLPLAFGQMKWSWGSQLNALTYLTFYHVRSASHRLHLASHAPGAGYTMTYIARPIAFFYINCISLPTYTALMVYGWGRAAVLRLRNPLDIPAAEVIWTRITHLLETCRLYKFANKLQEAYIIKMNEDDFLSVTEMLRRHGWSPLEIRLLLKKYGVKKGDDLSIDEISEVYEDFWVRNALFFEVSGHEEIKRDLDYIDRKIKHCDLTIADLKSKLERLMDGVLEKRASQPRMSTSRKSVIGRFWN